MADVMEENVDGFMRGWDIKQEILEGSTSNGRQIGQGGEG